MKNKNSNYFTEMRQVFIDILTKKYDNVDMDYLSMGMTNDFETAIACGATWFAWARRSLANGRIRSFRLKHKEELGMVQSKALLIG